MRGCNNQSGMTLVEVMAAGAILLLVSLMAARGFRAAGNLMNRGREIQAAGEAAKESAVNEKDSIGSFEEELSIGDGSLPVIIEEYGALEEPGVTVKVIKPK